MDFIRNIFVRKKKESISDELRPFFEEVKLMQTQTLNTLRAEIQDLKNEVVQMESKLQIKDIKDRQLFGQLHYKLHEMPQKRDKDS